MIDRLEDEDVGQVHAAFERVVQDEDVARKDRCPAKRVRIAAIAVGIEPR